MEGTFLWRNRNAETISAITGKYPAKCLRFVRWSLRQVTNYEKRPNTKTILTDDDAGDRDGHCDPQHNRAPNWNNKTRHGNSSHCTLINWPRHTMWYLFFILVIWEVIVIFVTLGVLQFTVLTWCTQNPHGRLSEPDIAVRGFLGMFDLSKNRLVRWGLLFNKRSNKLHYNACMFKLTNEVFCILKAGFFMSLLKNICRWRSWSKMHFCLSDRESAEHYTQYFDWILGVVHTLLISQFWC